MCVRGFIVLFVISMFFGPNIYHMSSQTLKKPTGTGSVARENRVAFAGFRGYLDNNARKDVFHRIHDPTFIFFMRSSQRRTRFHEPHARTPPATHASSYARRQRRNASSYGAPFYSTPRSISAILLPPPVLSPVPISSSRRRRPSNPRPLHDICCVESTTTPIVLILLVRVSASSFMYGHRPCPRTVCQT